MRSKFGTTLALAAVLLTGTAAAAINTQALNTPTGSSLGTAGNTLLPVNQVVAVVTPQPNSVAPSVEAPPVVSGEAIVPQPAPGSSTPVPVTSATASPKVVYGNPNPSSGEEDDDEDDDEGQDNDGDDD